MDIRHHLRILARSRKLLIAGILIGAVASILTTFKVTPSGIEWRSAATFTSDSRLFLTQHGFPWGRAVLPVPDPTVENSDGGAPGPKAIRNFADAARFGELAVIYSYIAQSDQVRDLIEPRAIADQVQVTWVQNPATHQPLPLLEVVTNANSAPRAKALNEAVIGALRRYLARNVRANQVPAGDRVTIDVLNPPKSGTILTGRSITGPVMLFLLSVVLTLIAVYVRENLRITGAGPAAEPLSGFQETTPAGGSWDDVLLPQTEPGSQPPGDPGWDPAAETWTRAR
jgi:hypothetical protein